MFTRIDHIGIAVHDLDASIAWYESTLDLRMVGREFNEEQGIEEAMMLVFDGPTGGSHVQLLRPTRDDSPIGKFLAGGGRGIHHIAYGVDDVAGSLTAMGEKGIRLVDSWPRHGSMGSSIGFLHPKDTGGVLVELVQAATTR
jgi:methylmalonyl-CoA/ethylmalonyl-CoA epimerase